jgi:uncharacterized protein YjbI with pentapeptide repeats
MMFTNHSIGGTIYFSQVPNLRGADLRDADLRGADLSEANLRACLVWAVMRFFNLQLNTLLERAREGPVI